MADNIYNQTRYLIRKNGIENNIETTYQALKNFLIWLWNKSKEKRSKKKKNSILTKH